MKVEDLQVYNKLVDLSLEIYTLSLEFPKFEMYELGSQIRRSSSAPAAMLAEGFGNKHTKIQTECISRAQGEIKETLHHLRIACKKGYITEAKLEQLDRDYVECSKMLYGLDRSLTKSTKI